MSSADGEDERFPLPPGIRVEATPGGPDRRGDPLTYREIRAANAEAQGEPYEFFDKKNKRTRKSERPEQLIAEWLRSMGVPVRSVNDEHKELPSGRGRPDAIFEFLALTIEIKTLEEPTETAIRGNIRKIGYQARHGVLDLRELAIDEDLARRALVREIGNTGNALDQILLLLGDQRHLEWRNE